ncbi:MAG: PepSY domain-containing protein [Bdellovibrionota bacterium]
MAKKDYFYYRVWRWHFYAGLLVIPVMITLAVTGSIYLFKPQLDPLVYPNLLRIKPAAVVVSAAEIVAAAQKQYPLARVTDYIPASLPEESATIGFVDADQKKFDVFVNPYSAQVLGVRDQEFYYQNVVKKIHGELLIGTAGDTIVELVSCWGLILIITGLYMWWPRDKKIYGVWLPRLHEGKRIFWRDMHAVIAVYSSLFICFLIITGLPWSGFWGDRFAKVWTRFPAQQFEQVPKSGLLAGELNKNGKQMVPWAVETSPLPISKASVKQQISIDHITAFAKEKNAPAGYKITYPKGETGVFTVSAFPGDPKQEITVHIDQYSGEVLADIGYRDYSTFAKAVEYGIALHQGQYFGWFNQLLAFLTCLALIIICVSGFVMWWQRKPKNGIGAPQDVAREQHSPKAAWIILGLFAIAFPLVGISLVVIFVFDWLVIKEI